MKSEKASQILLLTAGLVLFFGGIFRGEAAVVLSKAIKLCIQTDRCNSCKYMGRCRNLSL